MSQARSLPTGTYGSRGRRPMCHLGGMKRGRCCDRVCSEGKGGLRVCCASGTQRVESASPRRWHWS